MLSMLLAASLLAGQPAAWAGHDEVLFYADFSVNDHAWKGGNPYPFGRHYELADGAWHNLERDGYLGYDGPGNLPLSAGTVSLRFKAAKGNPFTDGQRHGLLALPRTTEGMLSHPDQYQRRGLALSVRKVEGNTLDLIVHVGGDHWMRGSKPVTAAGFDVARLDPAAWHELAVSWDMAARKLWLALDGQVREGAVPAEVEVQQPFLALCLGNTEDYEPAHQEPWDGWLDDVAVWRVPYPRVAELRRQPKPYAGPRPPVPTRRAAATLFPDDPALSRMERVVRQHLDLLVETQRHGGWCLSIKWPSLIRMSAKQRLPEPGNLIGLSKDSHTAFAALQLAWAGQALGEPKYFEAARRTGDMYLATQDREQGFWRHAYAHEDGDWRPLSELVLLQDHVQTAPILLLAYLHRLTGDDRYRAAALKGADFLLAAQNPSGSWSHHWDAVKRVGIGATGAERGGEMNDYGTSAPVETLLQVARWTGAARYRAAALKGADWLVAALVETDRVVGWAGQYDAANQPVQARHFEPASVTQYGTRWAADGLLAAYRATRDERYLEPLRKVLAWYDTHRTEGGWHWDYDLASGRPIQMYQRRVYFLDDPAQVQALVADSGQPAPRPGDWIKVEQLRGEVNGAVERPEGKVGPPATVASLKSFLAAVTQLHVTTYLESQSQPLNEQAGLYTWDSTAGTSTNLVRHQVIRFCDLLYRARAVRGDVPPDDFAFRTSTATVGWEKVLPPPANEDSHPGD